MTVATVVETLECVARLLPKISEMVERGLITVDVVYIYQDSSCCEA